MTRAAYVHVYSGMQVLRGLPWNWFDCVLCKKKKKKGEGMFRGMGHGES